MRREFFDVLLAGAATSGNIKIKKDGRTFLLSWDDTSSSSKKMAVSSAPKGPRGPRPALSIATSKAELRALMTQDGSTVAGKCRKMGLEPTLPYNEKVRISAQNAEKLKAHGYQIADAMISTFGRWKKPELLKGKKLKVQF